MIKTLRVLLVEDDPGSLELALTRLSLLGYQVTPCTNGRHALALATGEGAEVFDLVLLDLHMPDLIDGQKVIQGLRDDAGAASLPILVISSIDPDPSAWVGADHFIQKPYHLHEL